MPYIGKEYRPYIDAKAQALAVAVIEESERGGKPFGLLNFAITRLLVHIIRMRLGLSYDTIKDVMGTLDCVGKEFYRRVAGKYEDRKCSEAGDVFEDLQ